MAIAIRIILAGLGILFIFVGAQFLFDPVTMGGDFGLSAKGNGGLSTIRADMTAFFWTSGGALLIGVWTKRGALFLVTAVLMGLTLAGRCVSLALDGTYEGWQQPMAVEAVTVIACLIGARIFWGWQHPELSRQPA